MREQMYFDFPAEIKHVLHVREAVHVLCLEIGFTPRDTALVITAIWEAVLNAVTHGSPRNENDQVKVDIIAEDNTLHADITSQNRAFELPVSKPEMLRPITKRGRGLPIIYEVMDTVWLTHSEDAATLHMQKQIPVRANTK